MPKFSRYMKNGIIESHPIFPLASTPDRFGLCLGLKKKEGERKRSERMRLVGRIEVTIKREIILTIGNEYKTGGGLESPVAASPQQRKSPFFPLPPLRMIRVLSIVVPLTQGRNIPVKCLWHSHSQLYVNGKFIKITFHE